jgi:ATP-binding protein involved in chromosome partitioning
VLAGTQWGELDVLLLDLPPGPERTLQLAQMLGPRAAFVVVTTPSQVAQRVVARSLDALRAAGSRVLGYVDNMTGYACPGCGEVGPLFAAADATLPVPRLGAVPFDPALAALLDRGCPLGEGETLPGMVASRAVAGRLIEALTAAAPVAAPDLYQEAPR